MAEHTYHLPLADTGDGGVVAEIRVRDGEVTWPALVLIAEVLGRSAAPITVSFAIDRPTPLFVSVDEAAQALGVTPIYMTRLIQGGHLEGVLWNSAETSEARPIDGKPPPGARGWKRVIPWAALVALAEKAKVDGHLPVQVRRADRPELPTGLLGEARVPLTQTVLTVLREHSDAIRGVKDAQKTLSVREIGERVDARRGGKASVHSVRSALNYHVRSGRVGKWVPPNRPNQFGGISNSYWYLDPGDIEVRMVGVAKLTPAIVCMARRMVRNGETNIYRLAKETGVSRQAMHMAVRGETWQELDAEEPPVAGRDPAKAPARRKAEAPEGLLSTSEEQGT
jgi:hypothetical protein